MNAGKQTSKQQKTTNQTKKQNTNLAFELNNHIKKMNTADSKQNNIANTHLQQTTQTKSHNENNHNNKTQRTPNALKMAQTNKQTNKQTNTFAAP